MNEPGWTEVARAAGLAEDRPAAASAEGVDLVVVRHAGAVCVLSGRCPHRAARLAEHGAVEGDLLVCHRHGWDFRLDTGAPPQGGGDGLTAFEARVEPDGAVRVRAEQVRAHARAHPQTFLDGEDVA